MLILFILMFSIFLPSSGEDIDYRKEMINFIGEIRERSEEGKIIIVQNSTELFYKDKKSDEKLLSKIDGISRESLFYGEGAYNKKNTSEQIQQTLKELIGIRKKNKKILLIEYTDRMWNKQKIKKYIKKYDFIGESFDTYELNSIYKPLLGFNNKSVKSLEDVENFLCLLNPEKFKSAESFIKTLENLDYDLLIIDADHMGKALSRSQVERLKRKKNGSRRLVVAYFSIGEAENYRRYWKKQWSKILPGWIEKENPNWKGNYIVKYWDPAWKKISKDYQKKIDSAGFDGYFLDTVDTYRFFEEKE
ncbi:endo alpha-1,4 polygalactosaminidase [uncultured Ilyobacter sp.]|uniref:endo alpha-1,4 polygalactosaminidase n=1 Tax=uncultured Ilyobacter sp. TaxID=544433 RepID=UPI0029F5B52B|nr:endo alpha-1,4 polygalactosaminidase [uncultured Ilyobacter sp.]